MRGAMLLVALVALLAGCGTSDDRDEARGAVERFYDALRDERPAAACAQLSAATVEQLESQSEMPCREAIGRLDLDGGAIVAVHVFVTNAKVDLRNAESAFLNREPAGWKITAIGCRASDGKPRDRPLECEAEA